MLTKEERQKIADALITYAPSKALIDDLTLWVDGIFDSDTLVKRAAGRAYRSASASIIDNLSGSQAGVVRRLVTHHGYNELDACQLVIRYMDDYDWPNASIGDVAADMASRDS